MKTSIKKFVALILLLTSSAFAGDVRWKCHSFADDSLDFNFTASILSPLTTRTVNFTRLDGQSVNLSSSTKMLMIEHDKSQMEVTINNRVFKIDMELQPHIDLQLLKVQVTDETQNIIINRIACFNMRVW